MVAGRWQHRVPATTDGAKELWVVGADASDERRLPNAPLVFDNSSVPWSDGRVR